MNYVLSFLVVTVLVLTSVVFLRAAFIYVAAGPETGGAEAAWREDVA